MKDIVGIEAELLRPEVAEVMLEAGITVKELVRHGKAGLNATKERYDRDGDSVSSDPDWNVRHKYWMGFMEMLKLLHGSSVTVNIGKKEEDKDEEAAFKRWSVASNG